MLAIEDKRHNMPAFVGAAVDAMFACETAMIPNNPGPGQLRDSRQAKELAAGPPSLAAANDDIQGNASVARQKLCVLMVEDDSSDVELSRRILEKSGFEVDCTAAQTEEEFTERVRRTRYDVILADYHLPLWNGMESVKVLRQEGLDIPVIMVSGYLGEQRAVECIKQGAADYVLKDHMMRLPISVRRALQEKKLRQEYRQTLENLARSNRDLEQFAYVASHDLQEPLRMVAIYTQLLAERYHGKLDAEADKFIHYAVDGATRMQTLVRDLLAFSRVGRQGGEFKLTDCVTVVDLALQNLRSAIQESGAEIERESFPTVVADASQLTQLFQNLIGNAIKFRGPDPPRIRVTAETSNHEVIFSVADNGIGVAPEHTDAIFVIFKRLHTSTEYPGSGIGLAICKKIVERHSGRIWVEPGPDCGSIFRFTLPARKEESIRMAK